MRIAFMGNNLGTSRHRANALVRLGHSVFVVNPRTWLPRGRWVGPWLFHTGGLGSNLFLTHKLVDAVKTVQPELVFIDHGEWIGARLLSKIRRDCLPDVKIVNYNNDDPFGSRDGRRFSAYLRAVPEYDLLAVVRQENIAEAYADGANKVLRIWRSADEVAHAPRKLTAEQRTRFASDVVFVGTWMPERGPFMAELVQRGVPLSIWGNRWQKAPEWPQLARYWRGPGLDNDEDYAAAILAAKINLGLLSKGNRDLHTTRSLEIPALGGLFCAERTSEHLDLYEEGLEAVFWKDAAECAEQCLALLADEPVRKAIAAAGHARAMFNGYYNEKILSQILHAAFTRTDLSGERSVRL